MTPDQIACDKAREALLNDRQFAGLVGENIYVVYDPVLPVRRDTTHFELVVGLYLIERVYCDLRDSFVEDDVIDETNETREYHLHVTDPSALGINAQDLNEYVQKRFSAKATPAG